MGLTNEAVSLIPAAICMTGGASRTMTFRGQDGGALGGQYNAFEAIPAITSTAA